MFVLAQALIEQGSKHLGANRPDFARPFFRAALDADPDCVEAQTAMGLLLYLSGKGAEARPFLQQSLATQETAEVHFALGVLDFQQGESSSARTHFEHVIQIDPANTKARAILCDLLSYEHREAEAIAMSDALLKLDLRHRYADARLRMGFGRLDGWERYETCYEERSEGGDHIMRLIQQNPIWFQRTWNKRWDGRKTGHLFVSCEQGYGDTIQFMRFLPEAAKRCERLTVFLPESLRAIARLSFPISNIEFCGNRIPQDFDHYCLIMSLAHLLDRVDDPPPCPYLTTSVDPATAGREKRLIGLCWGGSPRNPANASRSIPAHMLRGLLATPDVQFVSLQFENCDLAYLSQFTQADWLTTANNIMGLDLVISVDTSIAHMAGALGKPVWLLNRYDSDWRWLMDAEAIARWYPTVRIFRQTRPGDWGSVLGDVKKELPGSF
jgi:tetratricopeptide (TPR) repeat protein